MKNFISFWLPVVFWMLLIFYFSSIPSLTPGFSSHGLNILISKFAHISEYAVLMFLLTRALKIYNPQISLQSLLRIAFLIAILYAISDEYHQLFVYGREGTFRDVTIDSIGITSIPLLLLSKNYTHSIR